MTDKEQRLTAAGAAWRAGDVARRHRARASGRSRWLPAAAAVAVVALALAGVGLAGRVDDRSLTAQRQDEGTWQPMAQSPLSARLRPTLVGWGDGVVVLGGDPFSQPCPPNASCVRDLREAPRDGAVYDVPSDTWERLPEAPAPLDIRGSAVLDDVLYVVVADAEVVALDLVARTWSTLPPPPVGTEYVHLVATGDVLVAAYGEVGGADARDLAYDPRTGRWEPLPAAPLAPSFDRRMVWTGEQLVLITAAAAAQQGAQEGPPFLRAAVLEAGRWRILPKQEVVIFGSTQWSWTGDRVVTAPTDEADGGQTNGYGRPYPSGGYLDPRTGRWTQLPPTPDGHQRVPGQPYAAGGRWVSNGEGLVLDSERERWVRLPKQPDAADQDASAAWAAGRLVLWGGATGVTPAPDPGMPRLLDTGAVWTPPED